MGNTSSRNEGFRDRRCIAGLLGAVFGTVAYTLCVVLHLPTPRYFPVERVWDIGSHAGSVSMGYYGNLIVSALVFGLAYGIGRIPAMATTLNRPWAAKLLSWLVPAIMGACLLLQLAYELMRWGAKA